MHMISEKDLNSAELETMRTSRSPTTVMTANGEVQTREEVTKNIKQLHLFVTVVLLQETPAVPLLEKLCEEHGYTYHWMSDPIPHLTQKDKRINCNILNYVSFEVRDLSTSSSTSSTPISSSSSSQDSVIDTENPAAERSGSMSVELRRNPLPESAKTDNTNKNEGDEEVQSDLLHELPD